VQVVALMDHFGLAPDLEAMVGATLDERTLSAKSDIVREALRRLEAAGVDTSRPVLIGDRHHDVEGGQDAGVPVIFVRWGFSWPHEAEGAQAAVDDVDQLRALLLVGDAPDADA
jgi:phosphoglycolate phosphatase